MTRPWKGDDEIESRELEDALRFVYAFQMHAGDSTVRIEALLMAVVKALIDRGVITREAFDRALKPPEPRPDVDQAVIVLGPPEDKYAAESPADLDCASLIPLCKARCCHFTFPLSPQDLDEGRISWDYAHPFHILHEPGQGCVHQNASTGHCTVYEQRPSICRTYDCRNDERIWIDFEKRIPAPIEAAMPLQRRPQDMESSD